MQEINDDGSPIVLLPGGIHLTRMFKEETDEALYQFIKRIES